jgi:hypothetical protein
VISTSGSAAESPFGHDRRAVEKFNNGAGQSEVTLLQVFTNFYRCRAIRPELGHPRAKAQVTWSQMSQRAGL